MARSLLVYSCCLVSSFLALSCAPAQAADAATMRQMMLERGMAVYDECYSPEHLDQIFVRACDKVFPGDSSRCKSAWVGFSTAFGYKDPNTVVAEDYSDYFNAVPVASPPNTTVFWSGVVNVVEEMSVNPNISSSANQNSSVIINTMTADDDVRCWCGNKTHMVDTVNPCPITTTGVFWEKFSALLAESASGTAFWMGHGDRPGGAYLSISFFAQVEFPRLTPDRVKRLVAINIYNCSKATGEQCGEGTLVDLQNQALDKYGSGGYGCSEVCGDPKDTQQVPKLADMSLNVIRVEQGLGSGYSYLQASVAVGVIISLPIILMCLRANMKHSKKE